MNREMWEVLNSEERHHVKYPAEEVVRFIKGKIPQGGAILDAGCGAGRHVILFAEEGFIPYGIDYSMSGVKETIKRLEVEGFGKYSENIIQGSLDSLTFDDDKFDGVVSYGVLYYMDKGQIEKSVREMFRVLKPGGKIMMHIRTIGDYRFDSKALTENDDHGCLIMNTSDDRSSIKEKGMFMHFFDKDEVRALMKEFVDVDIATERRGHNNDSFADENYIVTAVKPYR